MLPFPWKNKKLAKVRKKENLESIILPLWTGRAVKAILCLGENFVIGEVKLFRNSSEN